MSKNGVTKSKAYEPDYAVPPGAVLSEMLESRQLSHGEFARRCGRSSKLVSEIISGKAPVEPETALQFEHVLGMDASVWLNIETDYQLYQAKLEEQKVLAKSAEWASQFPIKDLVNLRAFEQPSGKVDAARKLLAFFGVGSIQAWEQRYGNAVAAFRKSPSFESSREAVAAWLRVGEIWAGDQECNDYHKATFIEGLRDIRGLTALHPREFVPRIREYCNGAGVAFVVVPSFSKAPLSGAARWLSPRKALIQQSLRHKSNDHFWFTFFHEAAHIVLHSKREVFIDDGNTDGGAQEHEANAWAANFLIPDRTFREFVDKGFLRKEDVQTFASDLGLAPGVVVGRLQYERVISWRHHNQLKERYEWVGEE